MIDPIEARKRGGRPSSRKVQHLYASIEHRVMDCDAYKDLGYAARSILMLLCRQLTKDNNGWLQGAFTYMQRYGVGSEHTVTNAIRELIAHGMVYKTKQGGYAAGSSLYAVTWLSVTRREGLFLDGYVHCAFRHWTPAPKKKPRRKCGSPSAENAEYPPSPDAEYAGVSPAGTAHYELMPVGVLEDTAVESRHERA
jgi:hypothetical protein